MERSRYRSRFLVGLAALALFCAYAWFPLTSQGWNAPDEVAANYVSAQIPLLWGDYTAPAAYAEELGGLVHPRSLLVAGGQLVPGMWLGLPWVLGVLRLFAGSQVVLFGAFIAGVSVLAIGAWQGIVAKLFDRPAVGWAAAWVLAMHPGWWYYTARGLHPNSLFVSCLLFGIYCWYVAAAWSVPRVCYWRDVCFGVGGLAFGMALFVRTNEAIWVVPVLLLVAWYVRARPFREHLLAVGGVLLPLLLMLQLNASIYGHPFLNGYLVPSDPVPFEVPAEPQGHKTGSFLDKVFPFGVHEYNVVRNVTNFHVLFFGLWTGFALFGLILLMVSWEGASESQLRRCRRIIGPALLVSGYLFVVYGSWNIFDNPDPSAITIGTSYIRYWLPISVGMTALAGYALVKGAAHHSKLVRTGILLVWLFAFGYAGVYQTLYGRDEGLLFVHQNLEQFATQRDRVLAHTEAQDLLIVDRSDKFLFPDRQVVYPLRSTTTYAALPHMLAAVEQRGARLYYLGITLPVSDRAYFVQTYLEPQGMMLVDVEDIAPLTLYRIERIVHP